MCTDARSTGLRLPRRDHASRHGCPRHGRVHPDPPTGSIDPGAPPATAQCPGATAHRPPVGSSPDPLTIGRRLRHIRRSQGRTLADVAGLAAISPSALSLIENGKREAKLTVLSALAAGLGTSLADLLAVAAPSRRAALEIELEKAQRATDVSWR